MPRTRNACLARTTTGRTQSRSATSGADIRPTVLANGGMRSTLVRVSVVLSGELFVYRNGRTCSVQISGPERADLRRQLALLKVWGQE